MTEPAAILLVDDEPANLLALEAVLQDLGEPLVRAHSGEEAMRRLRDDDFAAVLLDVHMPGLDGFETARLIRAQKRSRETPILFITAASSDAASQEAYLLGAVDFLTKPIKAHALKAKLGFFIELHRRKRELEAARRRAVQDHVFLATVLEGVEDGILACDAEGRITVCNRAMREFLGRPVEGLEASALQGAEAPLREALEGRTAEPRELVIAVPGQVPRTVLARGRALHDEGGRPLGAVLTVHDVSAWREAESARESAAIEQVRREEAEAAARLLRESRERLVASEERVRLATEAAGLGVWVWDAATDHVTWENEQMYQVFGLAPGDGPITSEALFRDFIHPADAPAFRDSLAAALRGEARLDIEGRIVRRADGTTRWVAATGILQPSPDGGGGRILGTVADITARKQAEQDLRRLAVELAESDRRKTEFLATLAHELRNPLAPISNGLHLLRMAPGDLNVAGRAREMMERQLRHMVHLVDDLLDVARISRDKLELRRELLDLRTVLQGAVETSLPLVNASRHDLQVRLPDGPLAVDGDATRLAQVVSNLLNNAAKYTPPGGRIELDAHAEGTDAVVTVKDTGVGILPEELDAVFEMFTQVGRNRPHAQGGLGIGLALVKRMVALHGGSVEVRSEGEGRGSTFTVRLPLVAVGASAAGSAADAAGHDEHTARFRVLVVDDNVDAAESLATLLAIEGHVTEVAHDGDAALALAARFDPEIVFLDIGMPGKDGYQVARALRRSHAKPLVLIALTGWGAQEDRDRARDAGFDHHLTKPAALPAVEALLGEVAKQRQAVAPE